MKYSQGEVWWGPAPHKSNSAYRPWLVISDDTHPFASEESIVVALTTQQHPAGIAVREDDWISGGADKDPFISPWYVTNMKHRDIDNLQGVLSDSIIAAAISELRRYTPVSEEE
jgi:hypothetical protein